ncbi:MAG: DUF3995 domain-containing protein [Rhizobiaceae bacterium]
MTVIAATVGIVLFAAALLHIYWGFGGVWPGTDRKSCARAVVGFRGIEAMPPATSAFAVALALFIVAWIALSLGDLALEPWSPVPIWLLGLGAALVFIGRGIAGFTPAWRRLACELPFARNDVRYFSPLCLVAGTGLLALSIRGWSA